MAIRIGKQAGETLRSVGSISTVGLAFVLALVIGAWSGSVLDRWLRTSPLFFIVFFFLGLAAGILNVYRTVSGAYAAPAPAGRSASAVPPAASGVAATVPLPPLDDIEQSDPGPGPESR
jgi:F0F1-type ATP synthase assembly protein I